MDKFPDYYAILEVSETADQTEIKEAYQRKALETHPDRFANVSSDDSLDSYSVEDAKIEFQKVADAYHVLSDTKRRQQYDNARVSKKKETIWLTQRPDPDRLFGNVFEELLRPEVDNPKWFYTPIGAVSGAFVGFICGNVPGAMLGAYAGSKLGAVRDAKGVSVYEAYQKLNNNHKAAILAAIAAKLIRP